MHILNRIHFTLVRSFLLISILISISNVLFAQSTHGNYYWIEFHDKKGTQFSIAHPEEFLSQRALARRERQNIKIDETDLPVSKIYTDSLIALGFKLIHSTKWLNGCTVKSNNTELVNQLSEIDFIKFFELTKPSVVSKSAINKFESMELSAAIDSSYYGASVSQISQLKGLTLHQSGFRGKGLQIAVLDNGFLNANEIAAFDSLWMDGRILGFRDFVSEDGNVFQEGGHGTNVLSTMGACLPGQLVGSAPDASFYLFRTEDYASEYLIEEDNWVAGAEYADSLGVDIINSSLGYAYFNDPAMDHTYAEMDGRTTRVTRAANVAAEKGILVFCSAGNEGNKTWHYLIAPSDGENVIGVGAVDENGSPALFTSFGPASDGRVKPNVSATGVGTALISTSGAIVKLNGTSFSSPLLAGITACLWQAFQQATNFEIKEAIEKSGSQFSAPDFRLGYGIPDFEIAYSILIKSHFPENLEDLDWHVFPNPFSDHLSAMWLNEGTFDECLVQLISIRGNVLYENIFGQSNRIVLSKLTNLPSGLYLLKLISGERSKTFRIVKR